MTQAEFLNIVMPFKDSERLWALRRKVSFQRSFPLLLISEFGEPFFEEDLKQAMV